MAGKHLDPTSSQCLCISPRKALVYPCQSRPSPSAPGSCRKTRTLRLRAWPCSARRSAQMTAEDAAERLQNIYGYYVDQKMWTDVTDLFEKDGTFEIAGIGRYSGEQNIRRAFGNIASNGLLHGEVNEHLQLEPLVTVAPGGREAWLRGFQLGMLGQNGVGAWWTQAITESHFVQGTDSLWRIRSMRVFPKLRSDYYQGWARSQMPEPRPARGYEPNEPGLSLPAAGQAWAGRFQLSASGHWQGYRLPHRRCRDRRERRYANGAAASGEAHDEAPLTATMLAELARQLAVAKAHDAVTNVSHAFGDYLDDFDWDNSSALFARTGRRGKYQVGFYVGPERIRMAETTQYGRTPSPRTSVQIHLRTQPVIDVSNDGMTAKLRTRLFSSMRAPPTPGSFQGAMYPNDKLVMQDGIWKFQHQSIDEFYSRSAGYMNGWAKVPKPIRRSSSRRIASHRSWIGCARPTLLTSTSSTWACAELDSRRTSSSSTSRT